MSHGTPPEEPLRGWPLGSRRHSDLVASPLQGVAGADMRATNAAAVVIALRSSGAPQRLGDVARATGLSRPTVESALADLTAFGLTAEAEFTGEPRAAKPGRPARWYRFLPDCAYVVGVDVRAGALQACVADLDGTVQATVRRSVRRDVTGKARARAVLAAVDSVLTEANVGKDRVVAATIATPGWVENNSRIRYVDNLRDWAEVDVLGLLSDDLGCPVAMENDANAAAVGERWRGVATDVTDLIFILVGERVGAGIIAGGRPLHGHHGAAGEIGFMVFPDGSKLAARTLGDPERGRRGLDPQSLYTDASTLAAADRGEPGAIAALQAIGQRLADALAPVLLALDPELVVLGASLFGVTSTPAAQAILEAAERRAADLLVDPPRWQTSGLGEEAALLGAVRFALAGAESVLMSRPLSLFEPR